MLHQYPYPEFEGRRNIGVGILLTFITFGIYGLVWQYKQMKIINAWLGKGMGQLCTVHSKCPYH